VRNDPSSTPPDKTPGPVVTPIPSSGHPRRLQGSQAIPLTWHQETFSRHKSSRKAEISQGCFKWVFFWEVTGCATLPCPARPPRQAGGAGVGRGRWATARGTRNRPPKHPERARLVYSGPPDRPGRSKRGRIGAYAPGGIRGENHPPGARRSRIRAESRETRIKT